MLNLFKEYLKQGHVKRKTPDPEEAKALLEKSLARLEYFKKRKITERASLIVLENTYESIREATQALMSLKGFKPYSHEATIHFLIEIYCHDFTEEEFRKFDRFRLLRNNSVYRAEPVTKEDSESCKKFSEIMLNKIKLLYKKESKGKDKLKP